MRHAILLISLAMTMVGCSSDNGATTPVTDDTYSSFATNTGDVEQPTSDAQTISPSDSHGSEDGVSDVGVEDTAEPPAPPCELSAGMCPNACEYGDVEEGGTCVTDVDCGCALCCGFGMCRRFDEVGCESYAQYSECLCQGDDPSEGLVDPNDDTPWQVEPTNYMDDCDTKTPLESDCNPFCQLGCPPGAHCALVDDARFTCVTSGANLKGATCENSSECSAWFSCFGTFEESEDSCRQVCDADEECPGGEACNLTIQFGSFPVSFCDTAALPCDIWNSACPDGMKCVISAGQAICTESTWEGIENYPCTELGDCAVGMQCVGTSCTPICSTADTTPLGATSCAEMCPGGYQTVDQNLQIGRCSTPDQP